MKPKDNVSKLAAFEIALVSFCGQWQLPVYLLKRKLSPFLQLKPYQFYDRK